MHFRGERVLPELQRMLMAGDSWWYRTIALEGYGGDPARAAFFPLFPLAVRFLGPTGQFPLDGAILSTIAFGASLLLLGAVAVRSGFAVEDAERAMFYLAFFPTSYFFSAPLTESLFLLLSLGAMLAALDGRWWLAGLAGGLAAATRVPGVLLLVPLLLIFYERKERPLIRVAWLSLVPMGLGAYMWHLHRLTGDAFAFVHAQEHWGRTVGGFWRPLADYVVHPLVLSEPWNLRLLNFAVAVALLAAGAFLIVRRNYALAAYTLLSVLLPLTSGSLQSISRYALVNFPLFLCRHSPDGGRPWTGPSSRRAWRCGDGWCRC